jgi:hypothetical protein
MPASETLPISDVPVNQRDDPQAEDPHAAIRAVIIWTPLSAAVWVVLLMWLWPR